MESNLLSQYDCQKTYREILKPNADIVQHVYISNSLKVTSNIKTHDVNSKGMLMQLNLVKKNSFQIFNLNKYKIKLCLNVSV
jgi:hypothetical protein